MTSAEERAWQLFLLRPLNPAPEKATVATAPSLPCHCQKAAIFMHISVHSSSVVSHEGSLVYELILGLLSAIFLQF